MRGTGRWGNGFRAVALACSFAWGAGASALAGEMELAQPDVAAFPRIQLFVYPTDEAGQPVTEVRRADVEIREDGRVVPLETLRDASQGTPVDVCLTIDRSGSMFDEGKFQSAREAAGQFLRRLRPSDRAALVTFADQPTLDRSLTRDVAGLAQVLGKREVRGGTAFYDALYWSVNQVALAPQAYGSVVTRPARSEARRVVLALTDGQDNRSRRTPAQIIHAARANGVTVYTVGLGSDAEAQALASLARATGGRYFAAPGPGALSQLYALIARRLRSEFALTYRTPNPRADGSRREVTVTLQSASGPLRASGWYQAPGAGSSVVTLTPAPSAAGASAPPQTAASRRGRSASPLPWVIGGCALAAVAAAFLALRSRPVRGYLRAMRERRGEAMPEGEGPAPAPDAADGAPVPPVPPAAGSPPHPRIDLRPLWVRAPVTEVGRAEENHVVLDSPLVSRRHARIERAEGEYRLVDVGSANGTFLNGERITEAPIAVGDVVRFADQEFRFEGEA